METSYEAVHVPGRSDEYQVEINLNSEKLIENGRLLDASTVNARNAIRQFIDDEESEAIGVFLGYAENDWNKQELWRNSEYSRRDVFTATKRLEEDYNLVDISVDEIALTDEGEKAHEFFEVLPEDNILAEGEL